LVYATHTLTDFKVAAILSKSEGNAKLYDFRKESNTQDVRNCAFFSARHISFFLKKPNISQLYKNKKVNDNKQ
jgi:hypothetical protein